MVAWRLLLATGEIWYADLIERTLFNLISASPSLSGTRFFYSNTLHQRQPGTQTDSDAASPRAAAGIRAPWFDVACCPTNIIRTLPSLSTYFATADESGIQIHQYADCTIASANRGLDVTLEIDTEYPFGSDVRVRVLTSPAKPWTLTLRVPGWCQNATFVVDGTTKAAPPGNLRIHRAWHPNDQFVLSLPMTPRWVEPDFRIDACRGTVALERGPLVYCVESLDQPIPLDQLVVDSRHPASEQGEPDGLSGAPALRADGLTVPSALDGWPYDVSFTNRGDPHESVRLTYVPYHLWGNRSASSMRVWVPTSPKG
jgi:DUF1680 family protein